MAMPAPNTLGHIAEACAAGRGDRAGLRAGPLNLPHMAALGLGLACEASTRRMPPDLAPRRCRLAATGATASRPQGQGHAVGPLGDRRRPRSRSTGAISPTRVPAFPAELTEALIARGRAARHSRRQACLGHGDHRRVRRRAHAHRQADLLHLRRQRAADRGARGDFRARAALRAVPRSRAGSAIRSRSAASSRGPSSANARDRLHAHRPTARTTPMPPPADTSSTASDAGRPRGRHASARSATSSPIAARRREIKAARQRWRCSTCRSTASALPDGGFVFANFVDFDSEFGHRRDIAGYAAALEAFDRRLPEIVAALPPATSSSSPPTTATTRPGAAPTTRASTCRSWASGEACRRAPSGGGRALPISARAFWIIWACPMAAREPRGSRSADCAGCEP